MFQACRRIDDEILIILGELGYDFSQQVIGKTVTSFKVFGPESQDIETLALVQTIRPDQSLETILHGCERTSSPLSLLHGIIERLNDRSFTCFLQIYAEHIGQAQIRIEINQ
jgi:hypothetical protein